MRLVIASSLVVAAGLALAAGDGHHDHGHAHEHAHDQSHDPGHEQHDAHVHGEAELRVAREAKVLEIEFSSPAVNLVGFEHKPGNPAQRKAVSDAVSLLKQGDKLFALAGCSLHEAEVETSLLEEAGHDHDHHKGEADEAHADFAAHYHFDCAAAKHGELLDVHLFEHFPAIGKIHAVSISDHGQHKAELDKDHHQLKL